MCSCIAARQLAQSLDRLADCRVPRKRFISAAAAPDIFKTPLHSLVQPGSAALYDDAVGHEVAAEQQILAVAQQIRHQLLQPLGQRLRILRRSPALEREQNDVVALGVKVDLELFCLLVDLGNAQRAGGELLKEFAAGILLILLPLLLEAAQIILLLTFVIDLPTDVLQRFQKRRLCHGLEQVLLDTDLDRLLRELKIIVAADEDDPCLRQLRADELAERESIHKRHFDIRDQDIRARRRRIRSRILPSRCSRADPPARRIHPPPEKPSAIRSPRSYCTILFRSLEELFRASKRLLAVSYRKRYNIKSEYNK